ncbi:hypothetical protein [Bacillus gaemokensis]|uniref:hypothetical protein n=1 Tax=Bacillus gaemokensis TaxID=574375 RepID=UPI000A7E9E1C|nr:hypothetical protein [Bacillus gaemokensis]
MENQQNINVSADIVIKQYEETVHKLTSENIMLKSLLMQSEIEKQQLMQSQQQRSE